MRELVANLGNSKFLRFMVHLTTILEIQHHWEAGQKGLVFYFLTIYIIFFSYRNEVQKKDLELQQYKEKDLAD